MPLTTKGFTHKKAVAGGIIPLTTLCSFTGVGMVKTIYIYPQNYQGLFIRLTIDGSIIYDGEGNMFSNMVGLYTDGGSTGVRNKSINLPFKSSFKIEMHSNGVTTASSPSHDFQAVIVHE